MRNGGCQLAGGCQPFRTDQLILEHFCLGNVTGNAQIAKFAQIGNIAAIDFIGDGEVGFGFEAQFKSDFLFATYLCQRFFHKVDLIGLNQISYA